MFSCIELPFTGREKVFCWIRLCSVYLGEDSLKCTNGNLDQTGTESYGKEGVTPSYLPTPPLGQDMTQGQFFKQSLTGLNSEFSFS